MRLIWVILLLLVATSCVSVSERGRLQDEVNAARAELSQKSTLLNESIDRANALQNKVDATTNDLSVATDELNTAQQKIDILQGSVDDLRKLYNQCRTHNVALTTPPDGTYQLVSYDDLMRNADAYSGTNLQFTGEVVQVLTASDGSFDLRVAVTNKTYIWTDVVYVHYTGQRVLENDIISFKGSFDGLYTYTAVLGQSITVPKVTAAYVTVVTKAGDRQ